MLHALSVLACASDGIRPSTPDRYATDNGDAAPAGRAVRSSILDKYNRHDTELAKRFKKRKFRNSTEDE
jgi:hypothetical protein